MLYYLSLLTWFILCQNARVCGIYCDYQFYIKPVHHLRSLFICRVQDLKELGELSPHWDNLRKEVMTRYGGIISSYQETLAELDKITGMKAYPYYLCNVFKHTLKPSIFAVSLFSCLVYFFSDKVL